MADRDAILLDFQQFTGVDDLDTCISILEHHEWNLQAAVLAMMDSSPQQDLAVDPIFAPINTDSPSPLVEHPPDLSALAAVASSSVGPFPVDIKSLLSSTRPGNEPPMFSASAAGFSSLGADDSTNPLDSTAFGGRGTGLRMLNFRVEYRIRNIDISLPDSNTVGKIKELLSQQLDIPVAEMKLHGWIHKNDEFIRDNDVLRDLHLPKENTLYLLTPNRATVTNSNASASDQESRTYELEINFVEQGKQYQIKFPGSKTIKQVKEDVVNIAGPVRLQVWHGWPTDNDSLTLAVSGIDYPTHQLQLSTSHKSSNFATTASSVTGCSAVSVATTSQIVSDSGCIVQQPEDSLMEVESDEDDFVDTTQYEELTDDVISSYKPLMPEKCEDQLLAAEHFCREFASRYGETHPVFYLGSLDDAIRDALQCKARDRKLLAIYLHHDQSIFANVFASQVLCIDSMVSFLCANFITWAWDLTLPSNRDTLLALINSHFGSVATNTVRQFKPDQLPLVLIISRDRGINEVVRVLHGKSTLDELMGHLINIVDAFRHQLELDIAEEDERDKRERVLQEQDAAYRESLEIDRAKAEQRKREEEEKQRQLEEEEFKRLQQEQHMEEVEAEKEAIRMSLANMLPEEPDTTCTLPITLIRFRCPGGVVLNRRFLAGEPLSVLLAYIGSAGYHLDEYKVLTTYPRRDLSQVDSSLTLNELKLCPQETLTLEQL